MTAFERQLTAEMGDLMGQVRPVDDLAIFTAITATQSPRWRFQTMFSAVKFVVAGVIVALFSGFLLNGVLTQPSDEQMPAVGASASAQVDPSVVATAEPEATSEVVATTAPGTATRSDLLPGVDLVTEEVEPGVYRVLSDGVRDLESEPTIDRVGPMRLIGSHHSIAAGLDGSVWLFGPEAFYRLGDGDRHDWPDDDDPKPALDDIEVGLDGVIWRVSTVDPGPLMSFDGRTWTSRRDRAVGVEVQSDGTVWAAWLNDNDRAKVGRFKGDGWKALPGSVPGAIPMYPGGPLAVALAPGDDVWLSNLLELQRFVEGSWQSSDPPGGLGVRVDVAPSGTVWTMGMPRPDGYLPSRALARLDAGGWAVFYDTLQITGSTHGEGLLMAGMDESIWISPFASLQTTVCEGVSNFDGVTLRRYLPDHCVYAMDIAPDGSVWIVAGEWSEVSGPSKAGPIRTYVITPEAVAATE